MKKRILSIVFGVILAVLIMPTSSKAADITSVSLSGITAPVANANPTYTASAGDLTAYTVASYNDDANKIKSGMYWTDKTTGSVIAPTDTFISGHDYQVTVLLYASASSSWPTTKSGVTATVNGSAATSTDFAPDATLLAVQYTFPTCGYLTEAAVTGVTAPIADAKPVYSGIKVADKNRYELVDFDDSATGFTDGVQWWDVTSGSALASTSSFVGGHTYQLTVYVKPVGTNLFPTSKTTVTVKVDDKAASASAVPTQDTYLAITMNYRCADIGSMGIAYVTEPVAGAKPTYSGMVAYVDTYKIVDLDDATNGYYDGVQWYNVTSGKVVGKDDTFLPGNEYKLTIVMEPAAGKEFPADKTTMTAVVNSNKAKVEAVKDSTTRAAIVYTFKCDGSISIDVTGVTKPASDKTPTYSGIKVTDTTLFDLKDYDNKDRHYVDGVQWWNVTDKHAMDPTEVFESGKTYAVYIVIEPKGTYSFPADKTKVPCSVNGTKASTGEMSGLDTCLCVWIKYECPGSGAFTITLDPNGGKVSEKTVKTNSKGVLSELPDPTREGYQFDGWYDAKTGGKKVEVNTSFTKNITLFARWSQGFKVSVTGALSITVDGSSIDSNSLVAKGAKVVLIVDDSLIPEGCEFDYWEVLDGDVEMNGNSFFMGEGDVVIRAKYKEATALAPEEEIPTEETTKPDEDTGSVEETPQDSQEPSAAPQKTVKAPGLSKSKKMVLIIIIILLLLAAGVGILFFVLNNKDEDDEDPIVVRRHKVEEKPEKNDEKSEEIDESDLDTEEFDPIDIDEFLDDDDLE